MKFVTLALAILLAVGCRAASLQADAPAGLPTYMEHIRAGMRVYLDQMKAFVDNVAEEAKKDPEIADIGEKIKTKTQEFYDSLIAFQTEQAPKTDKYVEIIDEATRDMRNTMHTDLEQLQETLGPKREELRQVVDKHLEEYRQILETLKQTHHNEWEEQLAAWKVKLQPVMENLRERIPINVEETKSKITPIIDAIRAKMTERLENLRKAVEPHVQEFKEQMKQGGGASMNQYTEKLTPHFNTLKDGFTGIINEIGAMAGQ